MQLDTPRLPKLAAPLEEEILKVIERSNNERIFAVVRRLRVVFLDAIASRQLIPGFVKMKNISDMEAEPAAGADDEAILRKNMGFLDCTIGPYRREAGASAHSTYKMVDTCAAEFDAERPYFYSAWDDDNEALYEGRPRFR